MSGPFTLLLIAALFGAMFVRLRQPVLIVYIVVGIASDRSVRGCSDGLGPMVAGNASIAPMNGHRASDIAGAWKTAM